MVIPNVNISVVLGLGCHGPMSQHPTRSKSLSKMLRIVQNERFTFEIDSENALLNSTWNTEDSPSSVFQFSTV